MPSIETSPNGALALHYAAARGCLDCARLLVDTRTGLTANTQMENEVTPVYLAAQEGHLEVLKFLVLEAGGSLYIRAKDGMAPVHAAAQMGAIGCLKWMVEDQGVDPNLRDGDGATPLHFAASRGHVDCVTWLLRHGAAILQDNYGKSPINDAAENQQMQCLNVLVQHGTSPDYSEEARLYGRFHGCTCRISDPTNRCSYADCVNYQEPREPFYLHTKENVYMTPVDRMGGSQDPFYLHRPGESLGYQRVRQLFIGGKPTQPPPPPPPRDEVPAIPPPPPPQIQLTTTTVTVDVHKSDDDEEEKDSDLTEEEPTKIEKLVEQEPREPTPEPPPIEPVKPSTPKEVPKPPPIIPIIDSKEVEDHEYEDIYSVKGRDSGSHSRSGSLSSASSHVVVSDSSESGVSSPSPSELGKSENEESEKSKLEHRHSLPHQTQNCRSLKRVVSVPTNICPPPPPPPPPEDSPSFPSTPASSPQTSLSSSLASAQRKEGDHPPQQSSGENTSSQIGHLVNKQMVLPFIPPKFVSPIDPEGLIKPSEYLRSLQGGSGPVPTPTPEAGPPSPPAPPLPPPPPPQPLSTITIQDIASVQLKRTKPQATKTMSCPPSSLVSNGSTESPYQAVKEDLIAELKMSKDISGIKKMKVERVKMEEKAGKEMASEISKQFSVDHFVEKMPEKDSAGNPIPPWKRQMLAKKAAEKARKEMEEQLAKEAEEKRLQSIPAWKRHLLQKKGPTVPNGVVVTDENKPSPPAKEPENKENTMPETKIQEKKEEEREVIIPWRAQLRKTNSTLNLLE